MKINQKSIRNFIILSCIVLVLFLAGCFSKTAVTPPLPEQPTFTHYRVVTQAYKDSNPAHSIEIAWRANSIDYSFKIFKSLNGGSFEELFDDGVDQSSYYQRKSCSCSFTDIEVQPGNQYSYYVLAYNEKEEIGLTETFSREIFLPPCTLKEPQDNAVVDTPIPTFSWNNQELTKYLTKSKAGSYLKTNLKVNDETVQEEVWNMTFEDTTVDNVTYNLDNTGIPLENEHEYEWFHWTDAYDAEGNLIANAYSNSWCFHYKGPIKAVLMGKIMVPETSKSISKDITGMVPLVDATVTITDSEGTTHTCITQDQGQYIFPQVAPGTNYIITAVGEVDGETVVYKDVVPSIELHEIFDAGIADAESTALALVMEAMLADDPNLAPEEINLDDILNASNFTSLVTTVDQVLNSYGDVTEDTGVATAVETVEQEAGIVLWLDQHAEAWLSEDVNQIVNMLDYPFIVENYNRDTSGEYTEEGYTNYLESKFSVLMIEKFYYQNSDVYFEDPDTAIVYSDKHIKYTGQNGYTFDEINKVYFRLIRTETGWKAVKYRVLCTVPMTIIAAELIEENGNYNIELYWRGYTYQDYAGIWQGADTENYRIYRKEDNGEFTPLLEASYVRIENEFWFTDDTIELEKAYSYYVTADGGELQEESAPSRIVFVGEPIKVGFVFDTEVSGVEWFNDTVYHGIEWAAIDFNIEHIKLESQNAEEREEKLRELAENCDLVIVAGWVFTNAVTEVADDFPGTKFTIIDGFVPDKSNVTCWLFNENEGSFLVGMIAGLRAIKDGTNIVGFVGGMDIPLIHKFEAGYRAGVQYVFQESEYTILSDYAGDTASAFDDPAMGKVLALAQYDAGAWAIYHASGRTGAGVFEAGKEAKRYVIGVDLNQNYMGYIQETGESFGLTSMVKHFDAAAYLAIKSVVDEEFTGGVERFGLDRSVTIGGELYYGVDYALDEYNEYSVTSDMITQVEEARDKIISGQITVPEFL